MAKQTINVGTVPNDGTGDKLNIAFGKVNANFTELYRDKEDKIEIGSSSQYLAGDKTWMDLNINAVVGLQTALTGKAKTGDVANSGLEMASGRLLGRTTSATGAVEVLSPSSVKTLLSLDNVNNTSDLDKPISTLTATALSGKEPNISAGGAGQYYRGDKTFQDLNKTAVGLSQVDNTSDKNKPVFNGVDNGSVPTPGATAFTAGDKFLASNGTWKVIDTSGSGSTGAVTSVNTKTGAVVLAKADIGLANVDNTSDANKPVSTATQTALDTKEDKLPVTPSAPTTKFLNGNRAFVAVTKATVGLDLVDNTADVDKPVSTATQTALDLKADKTSLVRSVKFFFRNAAAMVNTAPVVDVVSGAFTVVPGSCVAKAVTANTAEVVFDIKKNGTAVGLVTFAANSTTGVVSIPNAANRSFAAADFIEVVAPATGVDDLAGMTILIRN